MTAFLPWSIEALLLFFLAGAAISGCTPRVAARDGHLIVGQLSDCRVTETPGRRALFTRGQLAVGLVRSGDALDYPVELTKKLWDERSYGVDLDIYEFDAVELAAERLSSGEIDVLFGAPADLTQLSEADRVLATYGTSGSRRIVSPADGNVRTIGDLRGGFLAVSAGLNWEERDILRKLRDSGIVPGRDVLIVPLAEQEKLPALRSGNVRAAIVGRETLPDATAEVAIAGVEGAPSRRAALLSKSMLSPDREVQLILLSDAFETVMSELASVAPQRAGVGEMSDRLRTGLRFHYDLFEPHVRPKKDRIRVIESWRELAAYRFAFERAGRHFDGIDPHDAVARDRAKATIRADSAELASYRTGFTGREFEEFLLTVSQLAIGWNRISVNLRGQEAIFCLWEQRRFVDANGEWVRPFPYLERWVVREVGPSDPPCPHPQRDSGNWCVIRLNVGS